MTPRPDVAVPPEDIERAARLLAVRSRREAASAFTGSYTSAFRGGGLEFEESRPYAPGDDVRSIDWNATARLGQPYVKRFREERDLWVRLALDVSASMRFGTTGRAKAAVAAHALALIAAAAGRAGDRVGFLAFDEGVREELGPARGETHVWRVIRAALRAARESGGGTDLGKVLAAMRAGARHRSVMILLSDFRARGVAGEGAARARARAELAAVARRHDLVAAVVHDPRDDEIPAAGLVRLADPEQPARTRLLWTGSRRARALYRAAAAARRAALEEELRAAGADVLFLSTARDPLPALAGFFRRRATRVRVAA